MNDLISRQAAIDAMCELMHHWFGGDTKDEVREINQELGKLPSAQPERKHGKWICENEEDWFPSCRCSVCGCVENGCWVTVQDRKIIQYKVNFCPNCGADMREAVKDE